MSRKRPRRLSADMLDRMLERVLKPGRYAGGEINTIRKDDGSPGLVRFALVYPDLYDLGMANLSIRILYDLLNGMDGVSAERAFLPDSDMEAEFRRHHLPLAALDNRTFLDDFDFIGITIQSELTATNIPRFLHLSHVPILAKRRDDRHSIVIGGGPCLTNPEPYTAFFDLFLLGDGEASLPAIIELYRKNPSRKVFLKEVSRIEGVYVPREWRKTYTRSVGHLKIRSVSHVSDPARKSVRSAVVKDLDSLPFPEKQIVPLINIPQNRAILEVSRGCLNNCRFCSAGYLYRPLRDKSVDTLVRQACQIIDSTGYSSISLLSLSVADYEPLIELMDRLNTAFKDRRVQISLPSLRIDSFSLGILDRFAGLKKSGLTFALESMSPKIRLFLNKDLSMEEFTSILGQALEKRWRTVKVYLMFGFPFDEEIPSTIKGIQDMADYMASHGRAEITFHFMPFIPKAGTPFQWMRFPEPETLITAMDTIRSGVKRRNARLKWHDIEMATVESVISTADRDFSRVILDAWKRGAKFDGWDEKFRKDIWMSLVRKYRASHLLEEDDILPWEHIDFGPKKAYLLKEYHKAWKAASTASCRGQDCRGCGSCGKAVNKIEKPSGTPQPAPERILPSSDDKFYYLEIVFTKKGLSRWISHLDLVNLIEKALNVSGLQVRHSFGFSPRKKFSLLGALPLGMESDRELLLVEITDVDDVDTAIAKMNSWFPDGIRIISARIVPDRSIFRKAGFFTYDVRMHQVREKEIGAVRANPGVQSFTRASAGSWVLIIRLDKNPLRLLRDECGIARKRILKIRKTGWQQ